MEDAIHTAILTLKEGFEGTMTEYNIEIGIVTTDDPTFLVLPSVYDHALSPSIMNPLLLLNFVLCCLPSVHMLIYIYAQSHINH